MSAKPEFEKRETFHRIHRAAQQLRPEGISKYKKHDAPSLSLYWRCVSTYGAILILLDERYGEEALSLSRSLFEDSMKLLEIAEAGKERPELALWWINRSYEEMKGLLHDARKLGLDSDPSEALDHVASKQANLQAYMRRNNVVKLRKFQSTEAAAKRFGRHDDY